VGRATFASVLEALNAYLADQQGAVDSVAAAIQLAIAQREVSLETGGGGGTGGYSSSAGSVPGAGGVSSGGAGAGSASGGSTTGESLPAAGGGMGKGM
jgi:hypothetical protein